MDSLGIIADGFGSVTQRLVVDGCTHASLPRLESFVRSLGGPALGQGTAGSHGSV
jgi:hypothetical protein